MTEDWLDVLTALIAADARFLVVGAHALAVHGVPRATQDLDLWIEPTEENAAKVWSALLRFGAPLVEFGITGEDLERPDMVIQLGLPPNRIDLLTGISGIADFDEAWEDRLEHEVRGRVIPFLGRETLVRNKRSTGRLRDLADVEALGEDWHG